MALNKIKLYPTQKKKPKIPTPSVSIMLINIKFNTDPKQQQQ